MMFYMALPIHNITTSQPNTVRSNSPKRRWASAEQSLVPVVPGVSGVLEQLVATPAISWQWNPPLTVARPVARRGSPCTLAGAFLGSCYGSCERFKGRRFNVVSSCKTCQAAKTFSHPGALEHSYTFCRSFKTNPPRTRVEMKIYQDHFSGKQLFGGRMGCFLTCRLPVVSKRFIELLTLRRIRRSGIFQPAWLLCEWVI